MARRIAIKGVIIKNEYKWAYDWFGWDATCPNDIISVLDEVNGSDDIIIDMNSPGGSVIPAHEIYTAIASYDGNIEIHVVGMAGSAASEILTACKSLISPVASVMIHNCATDASGDYRDMDSTSQMLQTINQGIRNAYKAKTGLSDEKLIELMDKTTWMSAQDALEYGFVDGIMTFDKGKEPTASVTNMSDNNTLSSFTTPKYLTAEDISKLQSIISQNDIRNLNNGNIKPALPPSSTAEQLACVLDNNTQKGGNNMTLDELLKEHPEVKDEVETLKVTAKQEGVTEERGRLQAIDNIAASVPKDMLDKAKYTEVMNASELALKLVSETAASGQNYFDSALKDSIASGAASVKIPPADSEADAEDALINFAVKAANAKRKERK